MTDFRSIPTASEIARRSRGTPRIANRMLRRVRDFAQVVGDGVIDRDKGLSASIRIVNPQSMQASDFVKGGTATGEMLDFLTECVRYGISVCVAGATSSGKTTLMGWLLTTIPDKKRIYTIESGSRELALVREKEGKVSNSVIHTLTRDSENDRQRIDQIALLDMALRFNPDVIVVDPPRKGCEEPCLDTIVRMHPERVVYVSCDSATFARDLKYLCSHGYRLERVRPVDMFPQTVGVETVGLLTKLNKIDPAY